MCRGAVAVTLRRAFPYRRKSPYLLVLVLELNGSVPVLSLGKLSDHLVDILFLHDCLPCRDVF